VSNSATRRRSATATTLEASGRYLAGVSAAKRQPLPARGRHAPLEGREAETARGSPRDVRAREAGVVDDALAELRDDRAALRRGERRGALGRRGVARRRCVRGARGGSIDGRRPAIEDAAVGEGLRRVARPPSRSPPARPRRPGRSTAMKWGIPQEWV
jgi:hypothetical protein